MLDYIRFISLFNYPYETSHLRPQGTTTIHMQVIDADDKNLTELKTSASTFWQNL